MKGTWAYALTLAVLLTGCGAKPEPSPAPARETANVLTDARTNNVMETVPGIHADDSEPETMPAAPAEKASEPAPDLDRNAVIASYKTAIEEKIAASRAIDYAGGNFTVEYTLYDMDHNGMPELLVRYGTCEADYQIAVYTYRDGALLKLEDNIGGGHMSFGYDYKANQLVLIQGHMGYGDMYWYDLDENGKFRELINTGGFAYGMDDQPSYEDFLQKYNVSYLPFSSSFSFGDECKTYVYENPAAYEASAEFNEMSYKFLEDYSF